MAIHNKKTIQSNFQDIATGKKTFDIRKDRCNYQVGDIILFQEVTERNIINSLTGRLDSYVEYTGRTVEAEITYKQNGGYGLKGNNWCALGIRVLSVKNKG